MLGSSVGRRGSKLISLFSYPKFNKILYEVGKPCSQCSRGHKCDQMAGLCMNEGFVKRHPNALYENGELKKLS